MMNALRQQQILHQQQQRQLMEQQSPGTTSGANGMPTGKQLTPHQLHQLRQAPNVATRNTVNVSRCFILRFLHRDGEAKSPTKSLSRRPMRKGSTPSTYPFNSRQKVIDERLRSCSRFLSWLLRLILLVLTHLALILQAIRLCCGLQTPLSTRRCLISDRSA